MISRREFLAHRSARPDSVSEVVRSVRASLRATHAVECLLLFVAGGLTVRCAALLGAATPEPAGAPLLALCLLCGALCAAVWWLEHPVESAATARALDQRLRYHGALLTAFDLERRRAAVLPASPLGSPFNSMEQLVRLRVLERLRVPDALRVVFPPLFVPLAAPTLVGLFLVLLVDARRAPAPARADFRALAGGLEQALSIGALGPQEAGLVGEDPDGGLSRAQEQELRATLRARAQLPTTNEDWQRAPDEARARVEAVDRSLAKLAAGVDPRSELHGRLEEARSWLDALRMGLAPEGAGAGAEGAQGSGSGEGTAAPGNGTISAPPRSPEPPSMPSDLHAPADSAGDSGPSSPAAAALGVQAGSWWPAEYDGVVSRWVERTRAARRVPSGTGREAR